MTDARDNTECCINAASTELKLSKAFIFSVPILLTFVLLLLLYLFYLRRRRVDWSSLGMQSSVQEISNAELGLKKELREMLPIIVYKESFCIKDTQCSVCLGDYQADDRLQQIPACGHSFHMDCIDHWLERHTTCPLCRLSLSTCLQNHPVSCPLMSLMPVIHHRMLQITLETKLTQKHRMSGKYQNR